ncbi:MAG: LPS export ABC transporter periplasmic protein LptC [Microcoleaceae cyanobacterium]
MSAKAAFSRVVIFKVTLGVLLLLLAGCQRPTASVKSQSEASETVETEEEFTGDLTLDEVTLEQSDENGELLWSIKSAQVRYSPDQKVATVVQPDGELFQDGKLIYKMQAKAGEIYQDSQRIVLTDDIVATDVRNGIVLRGKELEWIVDQEILVVRNGVTGEHEQVQAVAAEAQVFTRDKRVELWNQVVISSKDPVVQLRTDHVIWQWDQEQLIADRKVNLDRYQDQAVTDRGVAETAELNLATKVATLKQNVQIAMTDPPLQVGSNEISWNYEQQSLDSPQPITIIHRDEKVTLTANQGQGDLTKPTFNLTGNVVGIGEKRQAQLNTEQLTWYVDQQQFQANGNVVYRQLDPPFTLTGQQAVGKLENETIVVSSGESDGQVVTEFVP